MAAKGEWLKIRDASGGPHFKYLSKRRFMDTSNWIRLKKGYDSLDASDDPPMICWERIGPERVMPLLTTLPKERIKTRVDGSSRGHGLRRRKPTVMLPSEAERPINAWTVSEIKSTMYIPKLKKIPKSEIILLNSKKGKGDDKEKSPKENVKPRNPYKEFYIFRTIETDPTMMWVKDLWKIAREFCNLFDILGTGNPQVNDSFMVNLLASGCHIKEVAPIQIQQLEEAGTDLRPLIFERPIDYGSNPYNVPEPTIKPLTRREVAFAYGIWYYPIKFWGRLNKEVTEKVIKEQQKPVCEEDLLQHPRYRNYYIFLKDKGYRIPQTLYATLQ